MPSHNEVGNRNLNNARENRKDEFYTQIEDIEKELKHYRKHFKNKIIFCNCDDPYESNFFKYFAMNFNVFGLKKLIATCYANSPIANEQLSLFESSETKQDENKKPYKIEITEVGDENDDGAINLSDVEYLIKNNKNVLTLLEGDGDFRSEECVELLKQADIVVTNPPFSLFREYVAQLMKYNKSFIVLAPMNALHYKEIFPLIRDNKIWAGYSFNKTMEFVMSDDYELKGKAYIDDKGKKHGFVPSICWFTNLDISKRYEDLILYKTYNPEEYPTYDNYNAINVDKVSDIPCDYDGIMGVPDSFLDSYNPDQFEIIGLGNGDLAKEIGISRNYRGRTDLAYIKDGKNTCPFSRILIRKKR